MKTGLVCEPWILVWQAVQSRYWTARLCAGPAGSAAPTLCATLWQVRQSCATAGVLSIRGFAEPCGVWHDAQPSLLTGACSKAPFRSRSTKPVF